MISVQSLSECVGKYYRQDATGVVYEVESLRKPGEGVWLRLVDGNGVNVDPLNSLGSAGDKAFLTGFTEVRLVKHWVEVGPSVCEVCGGFQEFAHDHKPDNSGLDDGPWMPHRKPRKSTLKKSKEELSAIRARAWATRRGKQ